MLTITKLIQMKVDFTLKRFPINGTPVLRVDLHMSEVDSPEYRLLFRLYAPMLIMTLQAPPSSRALLLQLQHSGRATTILPHEHHLQHYHRRLH